jgi:pyridoxine 5-phosphate synthase
MDGMVAIDTRLSVNLNKVALLRNSRTLGIPSVTRAAVIALDAGAPGITVHPRPTSAIRRSVSLAADPRRVRADHRYNIEGYPRRNSSLVGEVRPDQVTLVPDAPDQRTSDRLGSQGRPLATAIAR